MAEPGHFRRRVARARGITLVEMCLALAVLGMVTASIATAFIAASNIVEKNRNRSELVQEGRAAMNRLLAELRTATAIEARSANSLRVYCEGTTWRGSFARRVEYWVADGTLWRRVEGEAAQAMAEHVSGLTTGGLTLWSTLDEAGDVLAPQVGPGGSFYGVPYWTPVRFGTGFCGSVGSYARVGFPTSGVLNAECGTIEFWLKPQFSRQFLGGGRDKYLIDTSSGGTEFRLYFDCSTGELKLRINGKEVKWEPTWAPDQVVHVAVVWDCTGRRIGSGRTVALFVNGELSEESPRTNTWTATPFGSVFSLGDYELYEAEAAFENLRVYDYCKTDFRDRYLQQAPCLLRVRLDLAQGETGHTVSVESGVPVL
jgi:type II secretory pathway pseudopilin PulG